MKIVLAVFAVSFVLLSYNSVFAEPFGVVTSQSTYSYGDFLSFTVTVPEVISEIATFRIIDSTGMSSSSIQMGITGEKTTINAPNPFDKYVFQEGLYTLEIEYEENITRTEFTLTDSGRIIIPFWIKDVSGLWTDHVIDDNGFIRNLLDNDIIVIENEITYETPIDIPSWYETNAQWWRMGWISDDEFAKGLQHLISIDAVKIGEE